MKSIREFVKEHDIQAHLLAAVDDQGQGNWSAFEGLQTEEGVALVRVKWDGVKINFLPIPFDVDDGKVTPTPPIELSDSVKELMEEKEGAPGEKQPEAASKPRKRREQ